MPMPDDDGVQVEVVPLKRIEKKYNQSQKNKDKIKINKDKNLPGSLVETVQPN